MVGVMELVVVAVAESLGYGKVEKKLQNGHHMA